MAWCLHISRWTPQADRTFDSCGTSSHPLSYGKIIVHKETIIIEPHAPIDTYVMVPFGCAHYEWDSIKNQVGVTEASTSTSP
jgi:hypothetical protein